MTTFYFIKFSKLMLSFFCPRMLKKHQKFAAKVYLEKIDLEKIFSHHQG
jgi:hypothetical protein